MTTTMTEINPFHPHNSNENWKDEFDSDRNHPWGIERYNSLTDKQREKMGTKIVGIKRLNSMHFDITGTDFTTGTDFNIAGYNVLSFDVDGWRRSGWNLEGVHKFTGTIYNADGLDINGYDEDGWANTYGSCPTENEWLRNPDLYLLPTHRDTGTEYDNEGRNIFGFDADGYDRNGFDRIGEYGTHIGYDRAGFNPQGYNKNGYDRQGYDKNGNNRLGFNVDGIHCETKTVWSPDGIHAVTGTGYAPDGYDQYGQDATGYGRDGFNNGGWSKTRINKETGTHYSPKGLTESGLNREGFRVNGSDSFGYIANEKAPSRVFVLHPHNHHIRSEKLRTEDINSYGLTPRNLHREGWRRVAGQGWDAERALYDINYAFTHKGTGTTVNPDGYYITGVNVKGWNERGFDIDTKLHAITGTIYDENGWDFFRTIRTTAL